MARLEVQKTYKMFIGGAFPRTESGRYDPVLGKDNSVIVNSCRASRKDVRNAVVAARKAQSGWAAKTAYLKGQILYRIAEVAEGRKEQLIAERVREGLTKSKATNEVERAIDNIVSLAGWSDKFQQLFSSVNPVASAHFSFTALEPTGVVFSFESNSTFDEWVTRLVGIIVSGNSSIVVLPATATLSAIAFAEVVNAADVPGGVVNILTGREEELIPHAAGHMDVNALTLDNDNAEVFENLENEAAENMKRVVKASSFDATSPYWIQAFTEAKTTWHPVDQPMGSAGGY